MTAKTELEPGYPGNDRRGEARSEVGIELVRVGVGGRSGGSQVSRGVERVQARATARVHAITRRRAERNLGTQAAIAHLGARMT